MNRAGAEEVKEYAEPVDLDELLGDLTLKKLNDIGAKIYRTDEKNIRKTAEILKLLK